MPNTATSRFNDVVEEIQSALKLTKGAAVAEAVRRYPRAHFEMLQEQGIALPDAPEQGTEEHVTITRLAARILADRSTCRRILASGRLKAVAGSPDVYRAEDLNHLREENYVRIAGQAARFTPEERAQLGPVYTAFLRCDLARSIADLEKINDRLDPVQRRIFSRAGPIFHGRFSVHGLHRGALCSFETVK